MARGLGRRDFLRASAAGVVGTAFAPAIARATTTPPSVEDLATSKTVHDVGDAEITRYQSNANSGNFGIACDTKTGLVYVTQRLGNNIAVFNRRKEEFVSVLPVPTPVSGPHTARMDDRRRSVWYAAGESSKIGRLVVDVPNFVEYTVPGTSPTRKPHSLILSRGDTIWFTDDRRDRVGFLDISTGAIDVLEDDIPADGITIDNRDPQRVWVAGGTTVSVIDTARKKVVYMVEIRQERGLAELSLHDIYFDAARDRVWLLLRGGDRVAWLDPDRPWDGPQELIMPAEEAAGLDHLGIGKNYVWWTEGRSNYVTRHEPKRKKTVGYKVPTPLGYFNPHGLEVVPEWKEVWFTEREALCKLRLKDGRAP